MGNLLYVRVHAANIHDTQSRIFPAEAALAIYPEIQMFCADAGYSGTFVDTMKENLQIDVDGVKRSEPGRWQVLPKRLIVERTFAWLNNYRRLSKDYEVNVSYYESMIKIVTSNILLKRL